MAVEVNIPQEFQVSHFSIQFIKLCVPLFSSFALSLGHARRPRVSTRVNALNGARVSSGKFVYFNIKRPNSAQEVKYFLFPYWGEVTLYLGNSCVS